MSVKELIKEERLDEIMPKENGVKKTKTPRQYDSILKGALALELQERVELKKQLGASIYDEVEKKKKEAEQAEKISKE